MADWRYKSMYYKTEHWIKGIGHNPVALSIWKDCEPCVYESVCVGWRLSGSDEGTNIQIINRKRELNRPKRK